MYCAIIGDIVNSKKASNKERYYIQEALFQAIDIINYAYKEDIVANFSVTLGDEFQGLLKSPIYFAEVIFALKLLINFEINKLIGNEPFLQLQPFVNIRFGVGEGTISTDIKKESYKNDGEAYHNARKAMMVSENKKNSNYTIFLSRNPAEVLINSLMEGLYLIESKWTNLQYEAVVSSFLKNNLSFYYANHAKSENLYSELQISPSAFSQRLSAANYHYYVDCLKNIENYFKEVS